MQNVMPGNSPQGCYWIGTIPDSLGWSPPSVLPDGINWLRGQQEIGEGGLRHYQVFVALRRSSRRSHLSRLLPGHWELTRSRAAEAYVWKESTRVPDSQFELGSRPFNRSSKTDWEAVRTSAKSGDFDSIPADIYIKYYSALRRISSDHAVPVFCLLTLGSTSPDCLCVLGPNWYWQIAPCVV